MPIGVRARYYVDKAAFVACLALCAAGAPALADRLADAVDRWRR